jgi:DNA mismatch repair protein MutS2
MDEKTLQLLEYPRILEILAGYCAFTVSKDKARSLRPANSLDEAIRWQAETREAVQFLTTRPDLTIGGARDIRSMVDLAAHGGILTPAELLDIKSTLIAARSLSRVFEKLEHQFPNLCTIAFRLPPPLGLVDAISRAISDRSEILDSASARLSTLRRDLRIAHERLLARLQRIISDPKNGPLLQEALITQRDGRYVIPLRAEFKGRIKSIVHDQSSSGATLFVEPLAVVEANNEYREIQLAERDEERRILAELSEQVGRQAGNLLDLIDTVAEIDFALACGRYADDLFATEPELLPFKIRSGTRHPGSVIRLTNARHPLLDPKKVVAIDVEMDDQTYALVVTGPNTGGKTVTLKTVGIMALMAQSGLHIPAHSGSQISFFEDIYADIGDEQSIEQSLSTFSGHITNIIHILERANRRSLVILDELGAGTDPQEGAALARALLSHLLERSITTLVTTHHPELKAFAHATPGVVNASVEFDLETLRPSYHLTIGLPGRSNALAIAQRIGMPEGIISQARAELSPTDLHAEDLLDEIHRQRDLIRQARSASERARHEAEALRSELSLRLEKIEEERRATIEKARLEAESRVKEVEQELSQARRALARARQPLDALEVVEESLANAADHVGEPVVRRNVDIAGTETVRPIRIGDKVQIHGLNMLGVVTSLGTEDAEVQVGALRIRTRLVELSRPGELAKEENDMNRLERRRKQPANQTITYSQPESPGLELDLRGQRADEALDALDRYLDAASLAGLLFVRIIHGKGTGKLRQAVREALQAHSQVKSFEPGSEKEGGEGVTVVKFK